MLFSSDSEGQAAVALQQMSFWMCLVFSSCTLYNVTAKVFYCDTIQFCFGCKDKVMEEGWHIMLHECATKNLKNAKHVEPFTVILNASIQQIIQN
jgi:hypothetical protein